MDSSSPCPRRSNGSDKITYHAVAVESKTAESLAHETLGNDEKSAKCADKKGAPSIKMMDPDRLGK